MTRSTSSFRLTVLAVCSIGIAACASDLDQDRSTDADIEQERSEAVESPPQTATSPSATPVTRDSAAADSATDSATRDSIVSPLSESSDDAGILPEGFSTAVVQITKADGTVCEVCMWLADSPEERGRGLMGVTSLGTPEAMAFVWEQPTSGAFFMFQTVTPLSIAWFAGNGALVAIDDMDPCVSESSSECERFPAGGDYVLAIEVFQGDLASVGITSGATARLLPNTEAANCPLR